MRQIVCDRCGKVINPKDKERQIGIREDGPKTMTEYYDVCEDCYGAFFFWIDEVRNNIENKDLYVEAAKTIVKLNEEIKDGNDDR